MVNSYLLKITLYEVVPPLYSHMPAHPPMLLLESYARTLVFPQQPVCSLFVLMLWCEAIRRVTQGGNKCASATLPHLAFQQWQLAWSVNFSKPADGWADGWMPLQTATVVMQTVNKSHLLFWGTLAFPASSLLTKHGTCAHEIVTQLLFSAIYL